MSDCIADGCWKEAADGSRYCRHHAAAMKKMVVVRENGRFVNSVDATTRRATSEPQQFRISEHDTSGFKLEIAPRSEWVADPVIMDVDSVVVR